MSGRVPCPAEDRNFRTTDPPYGEALYPLLLKHRKPGYIGSDNGPEFASEAFQTLLCKAGISPIRIDPSSP